MASKRYKEASDLPSFLRQAPSLIFKVDFSTYLLAEQ